MLTLSECFTVSNVAPNIALHTSNIWAPPPALSFSSSVLSPPRRPLLKSSVLTVTAQLLPCDKAVKYSLYYKRLIIPPLIILDCSLKQHHKPSPDLIPLTLSTSHASRFFRSCVSTDRAVIVGEGACIPWSGMSAMSAVLAP